MIRVEVICPNCGAESTIDFEDGWYEDDAFELCVQEQPWQILCNTCEKKLREWIEQGLFVDPDYPHGGHFYRARTFKDSKRNRAEKQAVEDSNDRLLHAISDDIITGIGRVAGPYTCLCFTSA